MRDLRFAAITILLLPVSPIARGQIGPLSLCELFRDLDSHDGQRVTLRASYRYGRELSGLYGEACKPPATLDGKEIVPRVALVFRVRARLTEPDKSKIEEFRQAVEKGRNQPLSIVLTIGGVLKTVSQTEPLVAKDGRRYKARMFGHLGAFPAQLTVESIDAVEVSTGADDPANLDLDQQQ